MHYQTDACDKYLLMQNWYYINLRYQALFSFRFENYIPAGKALERMYENRSNWA